MRALGRWLLLVLLAFVAQRATSGVPGRLQSAIEVLVQMVADQAKGIIHDAKSRLFVAPLALTVFEDVLGMKKLDPAHKLQALAAMDAVLGLGVLTLERAALRLAPKGAAISEAEIEAALARRKEARAAKDFATSDALRDQLTAQGVEVMDGDPLGWDWKLGE